jgi:hypothetical protein
MTHTARNLTLCLAAALVASFAFAPSAQADRRSSLGGNLLIEDQDDVFIFPHTALKYNRLFSIDLATSGGSTPPLNNAAQGLGGNASFIFGDETLALGVATRRGDQFGALPQAYYGFGDMDIVDGPTGLNLWPTDSEFVMPMQWVDVLAAFDLGGSPLGVRLSLTHTSDSTEEDNDGNVNVASQSGTGVNVLVGYGIKGDFNLDLAAELTVGLQSNIDDPSGENNSTVQNITTLPSLSLMARGNTPLAKGVDLGVIGLLDFRSVSREDDLPGDTPKMGYARSTFGLDAGAGPIYKVNNKFTISTYATVGFRLDSEDPNTNDDVENDQSSDLSFLLPQLRMSGEFRVFDWLLLRTGAQFGYAFVLGSQEAGDNAEISTTQSQSFYRWIAGVGIDLGNLQLNGTFNAPFVLTGPNFIGGGTDMFAMLNVTYDFE